ncbi:MAG: flavodoxin family protein [Polyangiales bacterium]
MASKTLVVYFSRTGKTRQAAQEVARALGADLEEIKEPTSRRGLMGYLRSSIEATFHQQTKIDRPVHDPSKYDLVVIATPVWNTSVASPVRTYLTEFGKRLPRIAVLECLGGAGANRVTSQIAGLCGRGPLVEVALTDHDRRLGVDKEKLAHFIGTLRLASPLRTQAARPRPSSRSSKSSSPN